MFVYFMWAYIYSPHKIAHYIGLLDYLTIINQKMVLAAEKKTVLVVKYLFKI